MTLTEKDFPPGTFVLKKGWFAKYVHAGWFEHCVQQRNYQVNDAARAVLADYYGLRLCHRPCEGAWLSSNEIRVGAATLIDKALVVLGNRFSGWIPDGRVVSSLFGEIIGEPVCYVGYQSGGGASLLFVAPSGSVLETSEEYAKESDENWGWEYFTKWKNFDELVRVKCGRGCRDHPRDECFEDYKYANLKMYAGLLSHASSS